MGSARGPRREILPCDLDFESRRDPPVAESPGGPAVNNRLTPYVVLIESYELAPPVVSVCGRHHLATSYDRVAAKRSLAEFRKKRRSATPEMVAALCKALGYAIDKTRGKGSHWLAVRVGAPPVTIPTGNKVLGLKTATGILTTLEEVLDRDGQSKDQQG